MTDMIARLAPGASVEQAKAEAATINARVVKAFPQDYDPGSEYKISVIPFHEVLGENAKVTLWLLMAAAAFVMIISAANVANLTLMRSVRREHELVVRAALGAGTRRLRQLLLAENLVLSLAGAVLGLIIAVAGVQLLISLAARYSPRANEIRLDGMVLGFTLLLSLVVAVILSYAPKLAKEGSLAAWVAAGVNRMSGGVRRQRLQRSLVVAQIAVSVILLTGAGLLTRTMLQLSEVKTGLNTENILTMEVPFDFEAKKDEDSKALFERMQLEVSAIPGVSEVGIGSTMPLRTALAVLDVKADGRPLASGEAIPRADYRTVSPGYFRASGIPLLKGREFAETDGKTSAKVVILNKSLADRLFGDRDPIGQKVAWTGEVLKFIGLSDEWRTVVGVVGDTKDGGLDAAPRGAMFQPMKQEAMFGGGLVIRAQRDPAALASAATRIVRQIVPNDPIENVQTIEQFKSQSVAPRRLNAILVSSFGVLAVIIAAVGIAGVLAFSVSARTNEIGIRMSLGADSARVQRMILGEGGTLLGYGLFLGVAGALIGTRLIRGLLFGVAPNDPATLVGVAVLMVAVGIAACWLPALRAARIDPAVAIRRQ